MGPAELVQSTTYTRMNFDLMTGTSAPTIYLSESLLNSFRNGSVVECFVLNQTTGEKVMAIFQQPVALATVASLGLADNIVAPEFLLWENEVVCVCVCVLCVVWCVHNPVDPRNPSFWNPSQGFLKPGEKRNCLTRLW